LEFGKKNLGWTISDLMQVGWTIFGPNELQPSKEPLNLQFFRLVKIPTFFGLDGSYPVWTISQTSGLYAIQINGCRQKFKFIKNIKYEIWSLEKKNWVGQFRILCKWVGQFLVQMNYNRPKSH